MLFNKLILQTSVMLTPKFINGGVTSNKTFYSWLNFIWNRVDEDRIKKIGPDRAAAEWVLRCGGSVKFKHANKFLANYNAIPSGPKGQAFLEAIDASDTCVMDEGLDHLVGLKYLESLSLRKCGFVTDMSKLLVVKETLKELDLSHCGNVKNLEPLLQLKNLEKLNLSGNEVPDSSVENIQTSLPKCNIHR